MSQTRIVVPYRQWRYKDRWMQLVVSRAAKKVFKMIEGKTVTFEHEIVDRRSIRDGAWYDQITVTIERD